MWRASASMMSWRFAETGRESGNSRVSKAVEVGQKRAWGPQAPGDYPRAGAPFPEKGRRMTTRFDRKGDNFMAFLGSASCLVWLTD